MPQSDDSTSRSRRNVLERHPDVVRDLFRRLDLQRVVVDHADRDLHVRDLPADGLEIHAARSCTTRT